MILVLRALGVGDLATAVPALRGLRARFPERTLALAAPAWLAPLVDLVGGVDHLVPTDGLDTAEWERPAASHAARWGRPVGSSDAARWGRPAGSSDAARWGLPAPYGAVNLHGRGPRSHRLLQAAGPGRLFAFACPAAEHHDGPQWMQGEHEVRRWCRLLDWYGVETDPTDLALHRPRPDRVPVGVTVVHPGAKVAGKRWAPGRFAELARQLTRSGHRVVVTGSAAERELVERVARRAGLPGTAVLAGRVDLAGLAALVAYGRLVLSADTGVAHLATAYGTPSVVLFGPVSPRLWGPPPDRPWHRALWGPAPAEAGAGAESGEPAPDADDAGAGVRVEPEPDGYDGVTRIHPALASIGVDEVLNAADEVERAGRERGAVAA